MGRFAARLRGWIWTWRLRLRGAQVGRNLRIGGSLNVLLRDGARWKHISIGNDVVFGGKAYIRLRKDGQIVLEDGLRTGVEVWLVGANDACLRIGKNCVLGSYSILNGGHGIELGDDCLLAAFVYLNSSNHGFDRGELIRRQPHFGAPIRIGADVWLGGHVHVNKGVQIGRGAVIGAGAIVTRDIPEYTVAAGNPAKVLRERE